MTTHAQTSDPASSNEPGSSILQRGKACLFCRRRKIKCDGARPACGPCIRFGRESDCEYDDGYANPRVQQLEETVNLLEARIRRLEGPDSSPIAQQGITLSHPGSSPGVNPFIDILGSLSSEIIAEIINIYFQHNGRNSWFLHEGRFRGSLALPADSFASPAPALLTAVLLCGVKLSGREELEIHAPELLSRALSQIGNALSDVPSQRTIQIVQAHILLANCLDDAGRSVEARHHSTSAASLVMRLGLHKLHSAQAAASAMRPLSFFDPIRTALPPPRDAIEDGERINAFWATLKQDRVSAAVLGVPATIIDVDSVDAQIDTPWPLPMQVYEQSQGPLDIQTSATLKSYMLGLDTTWSLVSDSAFTQMCKACILFERATHLAATWRPGMPVSDDFFTEYATLNARIDELKASTNLTYQVICVVHGAAIQLHTIFATQSLESRDKCLSSAFAIVQASSIARLLEFVILCPSMGSIWAAVCRVLINEIILVRSTYAETPIPSFARREAELVGMLDQMQNLMASFAPKSAMMNYHLARVDQERSGALTA